MVDGRIEGVLSHTQTRAGFRIEIEAFTSPARPTRVGAEADARSYEAMLGAPVEVRWVEGAPA